MSLCILVCVQYVLYVCACHAHACACFCASVHEVSLKQVSTEEVSEAVHSEKYILGVEEKFPQKQNVCIVCVVCSLNVTSNTYSRHDEAIVLYLDSYGFPFVPRV